MIRAGAVMNDPKSAEIILQQGDADSVFTLTSSDWNNGVLYSCSRERIEDLFRSDLPKYGIYLLLSENQVYIGQTNDLKTRTRQHLHDDLDWWTRIIILTRPDDNFDRSDLDYLEAELIQKAGNRYYKNENKKRGNPQKVKETQKIFLTKYLREAENLLKLLGVYVFSEKRRTFQTTIPLEPAETEAKPSAASVRQQIKKEACPGSVSSRAEARAYLENNGITLGRFSYGKLSDSQKVYWLNPRTEYLNEDYSLVLNNLEKHELTVIDIPARSLSVTGTGKNVLITRHDRPDVIDLNIYENLIDRGSNVDFNQFKIRVFSH